VTVDASGISRRSNRMLVMIERRALIALSAFITVIITSWNGTIAHAMLSPAASPGRLNTNATSSR
jgi:hypothetical protein